MHRNIIKFDTHNFFLIACTNFLWQLNPETLTHVRGWTLPGSQIIFSFLKIGSHTSEN